jgi:hypothetical protein
MKRLLFLSVLMMFGASLAFISGCDDDEATNSTEKAVGDTLDPVFLAVELGFSGVNEITGMLLEASLEFMDSVFNDPGHPAPGKWSYGILGLGVEADSFLFTYHSNTQYWYRYIHLDTITLDDSIIYTHEDSLQFLHDSNPVQWPVSAELTGINIGGSVEYSSLNEGTFSLHQNLAMTGMPGEIAGLGDVVINGNGVLSGNGEMSLDFDSYQPSCSYDVSMTQTIANLQMNLTDVFEEDGCPTSGTISNTGSINIECTSDTTFSFSDSWTITQTFSGDIMTVVFENSTTRWTVNYTCGGEGSEAPWSRFRGICRNLD